MHGWMFHAACRCRELGLPPGEAVELISERMTRQPNPWSEVSDAVESAYKSTPSTGLQQPFTRAPKWPTVNHRLRETKASQTGDLKRLTSLSPQDPSQIDGGSFGLLSTIFPEDPLLCCGASAKHFDTMHLSEWKQNLPKMQLIVPTPMTAARGTTKRGKLSAHSLDNTGERRFLVVEQDSGSSDTQAGILLALSKSAPLTLVVHSGNKSIHGWFYCQGQEERDLEAWFRDAVALGADPRMWNRSQFTRIPWGTRDNGRPQQVLFLNLQTIPK